MIKIETLTPLILVSNTPTQLSSLNTPVTSVTIQADIDNAGHIYFGDSTVTSSTGQIIFKGGAVPITADNRPGGSEEILLSEIYVLATTGGDKVRLNVFRRKP